ncbi:reverse transcriptase domain-containing protein [Tanacetum coccineum]
MSTRSTSSNLFSPLRDPKSLIRRRNLGEPSSLFNFEEVMSIPYNNQGPPLAGPPPPPFNNNGPPPVATDFGLRHHMIQQVQKTYQFHGLSGDDTNRHIDKFLEVTQHMKQNGVSDDALRLSLFPYSLTHHATAWYDRLPRNSIHSFDDMMRKFLSKYFPPSMVTKLRNEIIKFIQEPHESLFEAWERYKLSIDRCPNHNMPLVTQIDTFYNGLTLRHRDTINAAAGGTFMQKTLEECYELIENMTAHHNHWDTSAARDETSRNISFTTTTESPEVVRQLELMNKNFQEMMRQIQPVKLVTTSCETCGGPHSFNECPAIGGYTQETAYATTGYHNPGGNTYQQGDRNLLSYRSNNYLRPPGFPPLNFQNNRNNQNQGNYQAPNNQRRGQNFNQGNNNYQAPNYQVPNYQAQVRPTNELTNYMKSNEATLRAMQTTMANMKTELRNEFKYSLDSRTNKIENQNNQIMNMLANLTMQNQRPQGVLPSNTVPNPREDLKAITTQSGATLAGPSIPPPPFSASKEVDQESETITDQPNPHQPSIPYPLSFAEALAHMPKFAKMVKDLLTNKEKLLEMVNTPVNENCSAVILKNLLEKLGDTRRFLIPCEFYGLESCMALADLGASINLTPLSVWKTLSLPELSTTQMTLELATWTVAYPAGMAEDVFVQVGKFTFPYDFVVVDYEVDPRVPLILGRPFLRTAHPLIDVHGEKLTLRVGGEELVFNVESASKHPHKHSDKSIHKIDILDTTCEDHFHEVLNSIKPMNGSLTPSSDPVDISLSHSLTPFGDSDFILEEIDTFLAFDDLISPDVDDGTFDIKGDICLIETLLNNDISNNLPPSLPVSVINKTEKIKSFIDDPPDLELKDLPSHLEYAFLEGTSKLPVIIAKDLKMEENEQLLKVLKSHKRVIAWKISDIRGINLNFCTHKILMEDNFKLDIQYQRRVNTKIHEVIKAEVIKLLDAGLIYPISDSPWEKTTFTCPYGTFAYRRMPFVLWNSPGTFQRCMVAIFHDMIEKTMEVFMDDFSVFGDVEY